ncbi:MAG: glycosyltransferase family 2 protein, partial [Halioglobus sp.]
MNPADPAQAITIVIPVYRDEPATRACLESVAASELPQGSSVLVIDDASPEPALREFCASFCKAHGYTLLANDSNQGFVRTANIGLAHDPGADVVLLNSDTAVANDWLARLQRHAYASDNIGTVTPFSNNGTICSYPVFADASAMPEGWSVAQLDQLCARANEGMSAPLPTAVGFCMYIRRDCLAQVGLFDAEQFGQGYGEECDFSLRAAALGWRNLLAADVFVFHSGNASFGSQSDGRKQAADKVMHALHPHYDQLVSDFLQQDPLRPLRQRVDLQRLSDRPDDLSQV